MAQEAFNSTDNINIPHNISVWFQKDFTGEYIELGDCLVDGVTISPEFQDFRSYRNGVNALRKRVLSARSGTVNLTLREPNVVNLQRFLLGGAVTSGTTTTLYDAQHLEADADGGGTFFDLSDAGETDFANITVTGVYAQTDVQEATNLITADILLDTDGKAYFNATDVGIQDGDIAYVKYEISVSALDRSEIFGATNSTLEGKAQIQARNPKGGVMQIWELASVHVSPRGDLTYALADFQSIPLTFTMQERGGTFGNIYCK